MSESPPSNEPSQRVAPPTDLRRIAGLLQIMADLRDPDHGCPWDRDQTYDSIAAYTLEEAYEVVDAIRQNDLDGLKDELGDLLLQVVFHAAIAEDRRDFAFPDVVEAICTKLIRRHPHIFETGQVRDAAAQHKAWEAQKAQERAAAAARRGQDRASALEGVPLALPALVRSLKLQRRAARVGFDWPETTQILDKITEESRELVEEVQSDSGMDAARTEEEYGDLLFVLVNLGRHLNVDAESALAKANLKFERRFRGIEDHLARDGRSPEQSDLAEMDRLWDIVKAEEKGVAPPDPAKPGRADGTK